MFVHLLAKDSFISWIRMLDLALGCFWKVRQRKKFENYLRGFVNISRPEFLKEDIKTVNIKSLVTHGLLFNSRRRRYEDHKVLRWVHVKSFTSKSRPSYSHCSSLIGPRVSRARRVNTIL